MHSGDQASSPAERPTLLKPATLEQCHAVIDTLAVQVAVLQEQVALLQERVKLDSRIVQAALV